MATLKDVAVLAGVSPITVSRVVNAPETVKEQTRLRVQNAMRELRYVPNTAARSLASNRTGVIDVYVPEDIDISNPFVMHLIAGISNTLSKRMYSFLILRSRKQEHPCDGYIVTGLLRNEVSAFEQYAQDRGRPVLLFGHAESDTIDCIDVDNIAGSRMGVEHLIELGHKKIVMINVSEDKDYADDRLVGYREALEGAGLAFQPQNVVNVPNSGAGGCDGIRRLLETTDFSAVFCATDTIAVGAVGELQRLGRKVPDDVSVIGFDGLGHNLLTTPPLTSIRQPIYEIGMMLAQSLLDKLDGKEVCRTKLVMPELLVGKSTAVRQ